MEPDPAAATVVSKTAAFEQINSLCESFLKGWKKGLRPSLEAYLCKVSEQAQPTLMRNLLPIELEFRRRNQESSSAQEYMRRFPKFAKLIRQSFFMSTIQSASDDVPAIRFALNVAVPTAARHLGDYELIQQLGQGAFGIVYDALHTPTGHRVALKLLPVDYEQTAAGFGFEEGASRQAARESDRLHRFKREFRVLADMNHPNLVGLHNLEAEGGQWFFTMDLIEGEDFLSYVRPHDRVDEPRLRAAMAQLVTGVLALHQQHVVHRDLKPTNVLVNRDGRVVILDFGLVSKLEASDQSGDFVNFHGTPAYAAPEQLTERGSAASDWYAVGTMLFEALTGERPFPGNELDLLKVKQTTDPPPLSDRPDVPSELSQLCEKLLARDPRNRSSDAELARFFSVNAATPIARSDDRSQALIGRAEHLALLTSTLDSFRQNRMAISIFISGKSGEGKSILIEQFLEPLRRDSRIRILAGRCYDRESVPFKALDGVIDSLASYWHSLPDAEAAPLLPDDIAFLAHLFPVLRRVAMVSLSPRVHVADFDRQQVRQRAFLALRQMMTQIARKHTVILCCDDLQWGDADSAEAVATILRGPESPAVLFLGSYRSDATDDSPFMQAWSIGHRRENSTIPRVDVKLCPLTVEQCIALLIDRLGIDSAAMRRQGAEFAAMTDGNPYLMLELVAGFDPQSETFLAVEMPEVVRRKLSRLPPDAESLLQVMAVSGKALAIDEVSLAAGLSTPAVTTITQMRNEHLVRLMEQHRGQLVDIYHDKIRQTVLKAMLPEAMRHIHGAIGTAIEKHDQVNWEQLSQPLSLQPNQDSQASSVPKRVSDLAYHFAAAENIPRAVLYNLLAAEQAKAQFAFQVAVQQYRTAQLNLAKVAGAQDIRSAKSLDEPNRAIRYRVQRGLGESLYFLGQFDEAAEVLTEVEQLSDDVLEQCAALQFQAEVSYRQGSLQNCIEKYELILRRLGVAIPRSRWGTVFAAVREMSIRLFRNLPLLRHMPPWRAPATLRQPDRQAAFALRVLANVVYPYFWCDLVRSFWVCFKAFNLAEHFPPGPVLAAAHLQCGNGFMVFLGMQQPGEYHYQQGLRIAEQIDDFVLQADIQRTCGFGLFSAGRFVEAFEHLRSARILYETKSYDAARLIHTRYWKACVNLYLGNLTQSAHQARDVLDVALQLGLDRLAHQALETLTRSVGGNLPFDQYQACFPVDTEAHCAAIQLRFAEAVWHLAHGRTGSAVDIAGQAVIGIRRHWMLQSHTGAALGVFARACREHAQTMAQSDPRASRRLLRRGLRTARWGLRLVRFARLEHSAYLREYGLALAALGKRRRGWKYIQKSCTIAERQGAKYELAQSRLVEAELACQLGFAGADQRLVEARNRMDEFEFQMRTALNPESTENETKVK